MGCESSLISQPLNITLYVLDSNFIKQNSSAISEKMRLLSIKYETCLSASLLGESMLKNYSNQIITSQENLQPLKKELTKHSFSPNIYVLRRGQKKSQKQQNRNTLVQYFDSYEQIIEQIASKSLKTRISQLNPQFVSSSKKVAVKVVKNFDFKQSESVILEKTLKSKDISYQIYQNFSEFQQSMVETHCSFVVTDYLYHKSIINLLKDQSVKVICLSDFNQEDSYDRQVYFITNNFLEIASEIALEQKFANFNSVKCSKVYIYGNHQSYLSEYCQNLQSFGYQVKIHCDLERIINETKYFFALTIIINPQDRKQVEKILQKKDYLFKTKLVQLKIGTQNTVLGLRKVLKELKKGYKAQKGLTKSVDIIDRHFNNVKFENIRKQLEKNQIKCFGYSNIKEFIKTKKLISPYIICSYEEKSVLIRYLKEIQSKAKIILFCNKINITPDLKLNSEFAYIGCHFGKILSFIKKNSVYNPLIIDQSNNKIVENKEKLKKQKKRISALKWCGQNGVEIQAQGSDKSEANLQKNFQFLNVSSKITGSQICQIQRQFSNLFKLDYNPILRGSKFKQDLAQSLRKLSSLLKLNFPEGELERLIHEITKMNTQNLMNKARQFFSSQNELGVRINKDLIDVQKLSKQQIKSLREFLLIVNLNFLSIYRGKRLGKVKLEHYLQSNLIQKCEIGSCILNKNYSIFYETQQRQKCTQSLTRYKIELQMEVNTLSQTNPELNSFFCYENKFIFSPYSQFLIRSIHQRENVKVIFVEYVKNVEFLKCYFGNNLLQQKNSIITVFQHEIQKQKTTKYNSFLLDYGNGEVLQRNVKRIKALLNFQNGNIEEAICLQKQVINKQQNLQNFDSIKLDWLNYQLLCFYFKIQNHNESKRMLKQLLESQPEACIREKIKLIALFYKQHESSLQFNAQKTQKQSQQTFKNIVLQQSVVPYSSLDSPQVDEEEGSESSTDQNVFEFIEIQNQFSCLQMHQFEDFQEQNKENLK